jgi:multidrug efflux pump
MSPPTVGRPTSSLLLVIHLVAEEDPETHEPAYSPIFLINYADILIRPELARLAGIGPVELIGDREDYTPTAVDPNALASNNLTESDVVKVLREREEQYAGVARSVPGRPGQGFLLSLTYEHRGNLIRLRGVRRTDQPPSRQDLPARVNGKPLVGLAVFQAPGTNALAAAALVKKKMRELMERFPDHLYYGVIYDAPERAAFQREVK